LFNYDKNELEKFDYLLGVDEAGRGPAAGGVYAGAVVFKKNVDETLFLKLNDSKKMSKKNRELLYPIIKENSYYSIKSVGVEKIEEINILNAALLAIKMAALDVISKIKSDNILTIVDGNKLIKDFNYPQKYIIKGDSKSASIAAASVLAKVARDNFMNEIDLEYPQYGWKDNKGYLTKKHIEAIKEFGVTPYHRPSFLNKILA